MKHVRFGAIAPAFAPAFAAVFTAVFAAMLAAAPAFAAWESGVARNGDSAYATTTVGALTLSFACNRGDPSFYVNLSGGPFPGMKNADDTDDSMMMWIAAADGRTARHPLDGYYYGPEDTFLARWITSDFVLDQFAKGQTVELTAPTGARILQTGMKGTSKARQAFRKGCGF